MSNFYEEWASETLTVANALDPGEREPYEEAASELSLGCREAGA